MEQDQQQIIEDLQEQLKTTKRQLIVKESQCRKDTAVLEQKNELLQMQIEDYIRREENFKKMNDTIMTTLNDLSQNKPNNSMLKEIQAQIEQHTIGSDQICKKLKHTETIDQLEQDNQELRDKIQSLQLQAGENNMDSDNVILELRQQNIYLQEKICQLEKQNQEQTQQFNTKAQEKAEELQEDIIKIKEKFQREIEEEKQKHEMSRENLEKRLEKNNQLVKKYQNLLENQDKSNQNQDIITKLQDQINEIQTKHELEMNEMIIENDKLKQNNKSLELQIRNFTDDVAHMQLNKSVNLQNLEGNHLQQASIADLKNSIRQLEISKQQQQLGCSPTFKDNSYMGYKQQEQNNFSQKLQATQESKVGLDESCLSNFNNIRKSSNLGGNQIQMSKSNKAKQVVSEIDKSLNFTRQLLPEDLEENNKITPNKQHNISTNSYLFEEQQSFILKDNNAGNMNVSMVQQQLYQQKQQQQDYQQKENVVPNNNKSKLTKKNVDQLPIAYADFERRKNTSTSLQKQQENILQENSQSQSNKYYNLQQKINNNIRASSTNSKALQQQTQIQTMQKTLFCQGCENNIPAQSFNIHYKQCQMNNQYQEQQQQQLQQFQYDNDNDENENNDMYQNQNNQTNIKETSNFFKIFNVLNNEKQAIEDKLYQLESKLQNSENYNGQLNEDRNRLKNQLNEVMEELNRAKQNQNNASEDQEACTSALKGEIKFLINKLLKAKGKLNENQNDSISQRNLNVNKSLANFQSKTSHRSSQAQMQVNHSQVLSREYSNFSIKNRDFRQSQNY